MNPHTNKLKISIFVYVVLLVGVFSTLAVVIKQNNTSNTAPTATQTPVPTPTKIPTQTPTPVPTVDETTFIPNGVEPIILTEQIYLPSVSK